MRAILHSFIAGGLIFLVGCEQTESVQRGFRGTSQTMVYSPSALAAAAPIHEIPEPEDVDEPDPNSPSIDDVYKNVQVLRDITPLEFSRLMAAMSTWIAPDDGCKYCHNTKNMASDEKYAKVVARRMLQMTRNINYEWKSHVKDTGVNCWTCHRGQPVPSGDWFKEPGMKAAAGMLGNRQGQNTPGMGVVGNASLPYDPLSKYLNETNDNIRVQGERPLAGANPTSIKNAEHTYGLMIYMSNSLGVNCSYCHNTRSLASWENSSPQRVTAWYGIRMVRELNVNYLTPLGPILPPHRWSKEGDFPKVGCQTCHKGAFKPLYGESMMSDYPELMWNKGLKPPKPEDMNKPLKVYIPPPKADDSKKGSDKDVRASLARPVAN